MSVVYLVLPIALLLLGGAIGAYVWAARRGQFDDLTTPAIRALHDDDPPGATGNAGATSAPGRR